MRSLPFAGLALSGLIFTCSAHAAHAACDTVLAPDVRDIEAPGSYCLGGNRDREIVIRANDVELDCRGRTITHRPDEPWSNYGIHLDGGFNGLSNVVVRNCRVEGWSLGIVLDRPINAQVLNNTILAEGPAITVNGDDHPDSVVRLTGNRIFYYDSRNGSEMAIRINHAARTVLTNNLVAGFRGRDAVYLNRSSDAQLNNNQLLDLNEGGAVAIRMEKSPRASLIRNTVMLRRGVSARGLVDASEATCIENTFINVPHSGLDGCVVRRYNVEQINNE